MSTGIPLTTILENVRKVTGKELTTASPCNCVSRTTPVAESTTPMNHRADSAPPNRWYCSSFNPDPIKAGRHIITSNANCWSVAVTSRKRRP